MDNNSKPSGKAKIKKWLQTIGGIAILLILVHFLEWYGFAGFIIFLAGMAGYRLWKGRAMLGVPMRAAETAIFGKPLDKDLWDKGEMKDLKVDLYYGGKKMGKPLENKHMAGLFFVLFLVFVFLFAYNRYTWNAIGLFMCLQFSLAFKTWEVIRDGKK